MEFEPDGQPFDVGRRGEGCQDGRQQMQRLRAKETERPEHLPGNRREIAHPPLLEARGPATRQFFVLVHAFADHKTRQV